VDDDEFVRGPVPAATGHVATARELWSPE